MAALVHGWRTTTNTHGCEFSALGAHVAASRTCSMTSSSTSSGAKARHARCRRATAKNDESSSFRAPRPHSIASDASTPPAEPLAGGLEVALVEEAQLDTVVEQHAVAEPVEAA